MRFVALNLFHNSELLTPNFLVMYPILFQFGRFHIYAYGFFIVVGFAAATMLAVLTRFFIEIFRGDPRGFLFSDLLSTSQTIGILLAIFSLFMLFYMKERVQREKDGCS